jgi:hypothetical protein
MFFLVWFDVRPRNRQKQKMGIGYAVANPTYTNVITKNINQGLNVALLPPFLLFYSHTKKPESC